MLAKRYLLPILLVIIVSISLAASMNITIAEEQPKIADKVVLISIDAARPDFVLKLSLIHI